MPVRPMRMRHLNGVADIDYTKAPVKRGVGQYIRIANLHSSDPLEVSFNGGREYFTINATDPALEVNALFHYLFIRTSTTAVAATITSGNAETYNLSDGQTLTVIVDGGAVQTATFNTADFGDITMATAAEVAAVIETDIAGVTAADIGGSVVITTDSVGPSPYSTLEVTGGTANSELNFSTTVVAGTGVTFSAIIGEG